VTENAHGLRTGFKVPIISSSNLSTIPIGIYDITRIDNNTFSMQGVDSGETTGTVSYSGGSVYEENLAAVINGTIDYLTSSIKNQITGGSGYTVNKMRIFIPETRSGATIFDENSYNRKQFS
jgi:hydroxyethylthiazole kinase-like sugar kinase family protein